MKSIHHVAVSFFKGQIQLAEVEHGKKITIVALGERSSSVDFTHATAIYAGHPRLSTFVYELEELMKQNRVHTKQISFALPTDPVFINIIPVDAALQGNDLTSYMQWEFEQYHPDAPVKDFLVDFHPLPGGNGKTKRMILVSVRRGMIGFLKKATAELQLQLHLIDIDHFSTEKSLRFNYPELAKQNLALFGVRLGRVDGSLIARGELVDYRAYPLESVKELKKSALSYLRYLKEKDGVESPAKIFLYGIDVSSVTASQVQRETGVETLTLNAVRNLSPSKKLYQPYVKGSSRFAAAIGLALRPQ
jgi:Tfp pilus assembly PilM family ATPase